MWQGVDVKKKEIQHLRKSSFLAHLRSDFESDKKKEGKIKCHQISMDKPLEV